MMRKRPRKNVDLHNGFGEWGGYMDAKKSKLEEQFAEDALKNPYKESNLFAGISIFVNGLTNPSAQELKRIMMTHGGVYHTYQKRSTTFMIANNLPDVKIRQITTAKIISPEWVVDCLKANKILDYSKYLLYTNCKISQPKIAFKENKAEIGHACTVELPIQERNNDEIQTELPKSDMVLSLDILNSAIRHEEQMKPNTSETIPVLNRNEHQVKNEIRTAKTAVDPNFLSEFYSNSRLHHIATLGASFKQHITQLRESHNGQFPALTQLKQQMQMDQTSKVTEKYNKKVIMHIDMDCFFVSVGLRSRPHLKGFPIAVTHSKGHNGNNLKNTNGVDRRKEMELYIKRHDEKYKSDQLDDNSNDRIKTRSLIDNTTSLSEIASCSYEARKMGVKNGMFVGAALKLCPQLKTIPYDFDAYKEVAMALYDTITQYTTDVEAVSCDEMYVNLVSVLDVLGCSVEDLVSQIRNEIIEKTQCPCSAGIGENKLQARIATKKAKPNGQFHLKGEHVEEYFSDIQICDLPGVGYSTTQKCNNLGLKTCADLQRVPLPKLQQEFGRKLGETLYQNCRGLDNKPLVYDQVRKSVSAEVNYGIRFSEEQEHNNFLNQLCTEVQHRLLEISAKGKTITLKYMVRAKDAPVETAKFMGHGFCDNVTKSVTLATYTCDLNIISQTVFNIKNILNIPCQELRGIGIQISKLNTIQNDANKKNSLKNMFEKVQAKQKLNTCNPGPSGVNQSIECVNSDQSERKPIFRKVKSFNDTPTRDMFDKPMLNSSNRKTHKIYDELDLSVLAELPNEIQEEILREKNRISNEETNDQKIKRPATAKKALARKLENDFHDISHVPERQIYQRNPSAYISEENILNSNDWRQILSNWLDNCNDPVHSDIQTVLRFFQEFACAQKLCELMVFFRYLQRKIEKMDCRWHQIYNKILAVVRNEIKNAFGSKVTLHVKDFLDCKSCMNKL